MATGQWHATHHLTATATAAPPPPRRRAHVVVRPHREEGSNEGGREERALSASLCRAGRSGSWELGASLFTSKLIGS